MVNPKYQMCHSYYHFGVVLVATGGLFFFMGAFIGFTQERVIIAAFFLLLGIIDLVAYDYLRDDKYPKVLKKQG